MRISRYVSRVSDSSPCLTANCTHWVYSRAAAVSCRVSMKALPFKGATFPDGQISEEGRQLALKLLRQVTPPQLNTLFEASGVTAFPHIAAIGKDPQNWTNAFLDKVKQIEDAGPCK